MPLINADRLTLSILPEVDHDTPLPPWAQKLRDQDERWQRLSQLGVKAFKQLVMDQRMPFAFETVFSHWVQHPDGRIESKADDILEMQAAGYFVVLLFVGLSSHQISIARVATRRTKGGHDVPIDKLVERFPRTQRAIDHAAPLADMALCFDNSRSLEQAFTLVRAQVREHVLYDCRDTGYKVGKDLRDQADPWLQAVFGPWMHPVHRAVVSKHPRRNSPP